MPVCYRDIRRTLRLLPALTVMLACAASSHSGLAQEQDEQQPDQQVQTGDDDSVEVDQPGLLLRDKNGKLIPLTGLPVGDSDAVERLLDQLALQEEVPLYQIPRLDIQSKIQGEVVFLTANLTVRIRPTDEWVRVPIAFPELHVTRFSHSYSDGTGKSHFDTSDPADRGWLLHGAGEHRIEMEFIGQVRTLPSGQKRLRTTVPNAAISLFEMQFNELVQNVSVTDAVDRAGNSEESRLTPQLTHPEAEGTSQLQVYGITGQTDIVWQSAPLDGADRLLVQPTAPARMILDLSTVPASLSCRQPVEISGGQMDQCDVRLPERFQIQSVRATTADGQRVAGKVESRDDELAGDSTATIQFSEALTGTVTIEYELSQTVTSFPQTLSLEVPDIDIVDGESANVDILIPVGLLVEPDAETRTQAPRVRVESQTNNRMSATAYRLLSTESRIDIRVSETEAFFAVEPRLEFVIQGNNVLLTAQFPMNVIHGSLNEMTVQWKSFKTDGWQILGDTSRLMVDETVVPIPLSTSGANEDEVHLVFPDRQSRQFLVEFQAFRNLESFIQGQDEFFLPDVHASTDHATIVSLLESDVYSMAITQPDGVTTFPVAPLLNGLEEDQHQANPNSVRLIDKSGRVVRLQLQAQTPEVAVDIIAALTPVKSSLTVHAELNFHVRHRDLSEVRLVVPSGVIPRVSLADAPDPVQTSVISANEVVFQLPEPTRGEFQVDVYYQWAPADTDSASLPLVLPVFPVNSVTVGVDESHVLHVENSDTWLPVYSNRFAAAWMATTTEGSLPVVFDIPLRSTVVDSPRVLVAKSVVGTRSVLTELTAIFNRPQSVVMFSVPDSCEVIAASVDNHPVESFPVSESGESGQGRLWRIRVDGSGTNDTAESYTISIRVRQSYRSSHHLCSQIQPDLPMIIGSQQSTTLVWSISTDDYRTLFVDQGEMDWSAEQNDHPLAFFSRSRSSVNSSVMAVLSPYSTPVREAVTSRFIDESASPAVVLVGESGTYPETVVLVSRSAVVLGTAILGFTAFIVLLRIHGAPLVTLCATLLLSLVLLFIVLPGIYVSVLIHMAPGLVVAMIAVLVQKVITRRRSPFGVTRSVADASTVFTTGHDERSDVASGQFVVNKLSSVSQAESLQ